ncbi:hypothetical protein, partial [Acidihalobacter prosperus]
MLTPLVAAQTDLLDPAFGLAGFAVGLTFAEQRMIVQQVAGWLSGFRALWFAHGGFLVGGLLVPGAYSV